jgi:hypothetical protein
VNDLERIDGLFVGLLSQDELELLEDAITHGKAMRWYQGGAGFMGLAKVKLLPADPPNK